MKHFVNEKTNKLIIAIEILIFNVFGLFGNIHIVVLILKKSRLRSKSTLLQCALAISQIVCLVSELPNAWLLFIDKDVPRVTCFKLVSIYIFFTCLQTSIILLLVIDVFVIIYFPTIYHKTSDFKYLFCFLFSPCVYGTSIVVIGYLTVDNEILHYCNPFLAVHPSVSRWFCDLEVFINTLTLIAFILLITVFSRQKQKKSTQKIMKRLKVSVILFTVSWYMCSLGVNIISMIGLDDETFSTIEANLVVFALLCFSETFYVMIWKSPEYRDAFLDLWSCIPRVKQYRLSVKPVTSLQAITQV